MGGVCTTSVDTLPDAKSVLSGTQIPEWVSAAGRQLYEQAAEMAASEFPVYQGERIATYTDPVTGEVSRLTAEEREAADLLGQGTATFDSYITDAENMAAQLGQGYTPATRASLEGPAFDLATAQPFLDIYQSAQDAAVREIGQQTQ